MGSSHELQYNGLLFFFAMAIADSAFKCYKTVDNLMSAQLPIGRSIWELEWKDVILDLPVLRMASAEGIHKGKALTYAALWNQIVPLGRRVGFWDPVKIHAIQAGVANTIKGELSIPAV